jgi:TRAP-type uncharacterized transport system fused permease subunit
MGLATFIVPFMFFYSPLLLGQGPDRGRAAGSRHGSDRGRALACATEGWLGGPLNRPLRAVTFAAAILLITPA